LETYCGLPTGLERSAPDRRSAEGGRRIEKILLDYTADYIYDCELKMCEDRWKNGFYGDSTLAIAAINTLYAIRIGEYILSVFKADFMPLLVFVPYDPAPFHVLVYYILPYISRGILKNFSRASGALTWLCRNCTDYFFLSLAGFARATALKSFCEGKMA
jgi:hypothetical protein